MLGVQLNQCQMLDNVLIKLDCNLPTGFNTIIHQHQRQAYRLTCIIL